MNSKQQLTVNKFLFFGALILSFVSFFLSLKGKNELYPFFHWRLYGQPLGNTYSYNDYRIYGVYKNDTVRISNKGYNNLNKDDYYYFLSNEVQKINSNQYSKQYHKKRLHDFGKLIVPKHQYYLLVKESFSPINIAKDSTKFSKKIIFSSQ